MCAFVDRHLEKGALSLAEANLNSASVLTPFHELSFQRHEVIRCGWKIQHGILIDIFILLNIWTMSEYFIKVEGVRFFIQLRFHRYFLLYHICYQWLLYKTSRWVTVTNSILCIWTVQLEISVTGRGERCVELQVTMTDTSLRLDRRHALRSPTRTTVDGLQSPMTKFFFFL